MEFINRKLFFTLIIVITFVGCKKIKDEVVDPALTQNLADMLSSDPTLSKFSDYVKRTGVDTLLRSSKTFTVWAPNDNALQSLDPAIVADVVKLKAFVLNHIAFQTFFKRDVQGYIRVPMVNGKYNNFTGSKIEDATLLIADKVAGNGVLHVIDKPLLVLPNIWDYINSTTSLYLQNAFIAGLNFSSFNPSLATIDSISASTGLPVYHPGTGIVIRNIFNDRTFDTKREDKQYTYFIIANAGFTLKADSLKPYFKSVSIPTTDSLDKWYIVKDLIVDTLYPTAASIPNILTSKFGISVPVNKSLIIDTKKLSNGIAYVLSLSDVVTSGKFLPVVVQGENPSGFFSDKTSNTSFQRIRKDRPDTTKTFTDLMVSGHAVTDYYAYYRLNEMPTMKYNVYARAINDFQTQVVYQSLNAYSFVSPSTFTQIPAVPAFLPTAPRTPAQLWYPVPSIRGGTAPLPAYYTFTAPSFAAVALTTPDGAYNELFLGSFTSNAYGTLEIRLQCGPTATTLPALPVFGATGQGPIVLDYFRLVPVP